MPRRLTAALWTPIARVGSTIRRYTFRPVRPRQGTIRPRMRRGRPGGAFSTPPEDRGFRADADDEPSQSDDRPQRRLYFRLTKGQPGQYRVPGHVRYEDLSEPR